MVEIQITCYYVGVISVSVLSNENTGRKSNATLRNNESAFKHQFLSLLYVLHLMSVHQPEWWWCEQLCIRESKEGYASSREMHN